MPPLRRNRDFVLLQFGQLLSAAGSGAASIAYPLLALAVTHSPAAAGIVGFASMIPMAVLSLPAGLAADRWSRKRLMIAADVLRAIAVGALAAAAYLHELSLWSIAVVALVEGTGGTVFGSAQAGALRSVVPPRQLPAATGAVEVRRSAVRLGAPPLGGALFGIARGLPFLVDAVSYTASTVALLAMRTPFQQPREQDGATVRARLVEGIWFLWSNAFLRATALIYGLGNFLMPGVLLVLVVVARRQGLTAAQIGTLLALLGAATLLGSLASPLHRRFLGVRTILLLELWTWLGTWVFVARPSVYSLLAVIVPFGLCAPVTDSVVLGLAAVMTPDRLIGRVESVRRTISVSIAPFGSLTAGFLLDTVSARTTVAIFGGFGLVLALWGTLSPGLRHAPKLDEIDDLAAASGLP